MFEIFRVLLIAKNVPLILFKKAEWMKNYPFVTWISKYLKLYLDLSRSNLAINTLLSVPNKKSIIVVLKILESIGSNNQPVHS